MMSTGGCVLFLLLVSERRFRMPTWRHDSRPECMSSFRLLTTEPTLRQSLKKTGSLDPRNPRDDDRLPRPDPSDTSGSDIWVPRGTTGGQEVSDSPSPAPMHSLRIYMTCSGGGCCEQQIPVPRNGGPVPPGGHHLLPTRP